RLIPISDVMRDWILEFVWILDPGIWDLHKRGCPFGTASKKQLKKVRRMTLSAGSGVFLWKTDQIHHPHFEV
ncbi:MAG TPA: hypothetical protein P5184_03045, partial [Bacteroidales bacterium]|nr:hypothetical protein [Bacteroidales bacterium]